MDPNNTIIEKLSKCSFFALLAVVATSKMLFMLASDVQKPVAYILVLISL